jgi:two-component system response regulator AtoC
MPHQDAGVSAITMPMIDQSLAPPSCDRPAQARELSPAKEEHHGQESKRILVADDDATIRGYISLALSRTGFEVEAVKDGEEGWRALCKRKFALVITDHEMPNMTGLNLIKKVREASIDSPCILISATLPGTASTLMPLIQPGAILEKPFVFASLVKVVRSLLKQEAAQVAFAE